MPRTRTTASSRLILTDIDNTLLRFNESFHAWMAQNGYRRRFDTEDQYDLADTYGLSKQTIEAMFSAFFDDDAGRTIPPEPCARIVVRALRQQGWHFQAITACPERHANARSANLHRAFGFDMPVICVGWGGDKRPALASFERATWVEDHAHNALAGAQEGHRAFLLERPYNHAYRLPLLERVYDWHEIALRINSGGTYT